MRKSRLEEQREDLGVWRFLAAQTILGHSPVPIRDDFIQVINIPSRTSRSSSERKIMPPRGLLA